MPSILPQALPGWQIHPRTGLPLRSPSSAAFQPLWHWKKPWKRGWTKYENSSWHLCYMDAIQNREPFADAAKDIFRKTAMNSFIGCITAKASTDIYYLTHRCIHSDKDTRTILSKLFSLFDVLDQLYRGKIFVIIIKRERLSCRFAWKNARRLCLTLLFSNFQFSISNFQFLIQTILFLKFKQTAFPLWCGQQIPFF